MVFFLPSTTTTQTRRPATILTTSVAGHRGKPVPECQISLTVAAAGGVGDGSILR